MNKDKLIIEFLGYKLVKCNNGMAWEIPYKRQRLEEMKPIQGRLYREGDSYGFDTDWNLLMYLVDRIRSSAEIVEIKLREYATIIMNGEEFTCHCEDTDDITMVYNSCIKYIEWYNG